MNYHNEAIGEPLFILSEELSNEQPIRSSFQQIMYLCINEGLFHVYTLLKIAFSLTFWLHNCHQQCLPDPKPRSFQSVVRLVHLETKETYFPL